MSSQMQIITIWPFSKCITSWILFRILFTQSIILQSVSIPEVAQWQTRYDTMIMNDNWEERDMKQSWPILRYYTITYTQTPRKTTKVQFKNTVCESHTSSTAVCRKDNFTSCTHITAEAQETEANSVDAQQPTWLLSIEPAPLLMFQQLYIQNKGAPLTCWMKLWNFDQITANTF
jgi:hypothetical protein